MDHGEAELSDRSGAAVTVSRLWCPSWCGQRERPARTVCHAPGSLGLPKPARLRLAEETAGTVPTMVRWKAWWMLGAKVLRPHFSKQISSPKHRGLCWLLCSEWLLLPCLWLPAQRLPGRPPPCPGSLT